MNESRRGAGRRALERILDSQHLAQLVPRLRPEALQHVIQTCGIEDCGELLALATPAQLKELCDLDLWRQERPGQTETFDAARFGVWLAVLVDTSPSVAAARLAELDLDVVATGFAQHARVFDAAAVSDYVTTDGDVMSARRLDDRLTADLGGYVIVARRADAWDAVVAALMCLETDQPACFHDVMRAVRALSNSTPEPDGLHDLLADGDQLTYDARIDRERRRERKGYVAVGDARAFLQAAHQAEVEASPVRRAPVASRFASEDDASVSRALLPGWQAAPHLERIRGQMLFLADRDAGAYAARNADLVFLTNALITGCSIQGRALAAQEAWDAAAATCNLGLESLGAPEGFLVHHDLRRVFQTGWTMLYDDVVMYTADQLAAVLARLRCPDRMIQAEIEALRYELVKQLRTGTPWQARARMDVLASLDMPAWTALLGLIDECPVRHAVIAAARSRRTHVVSATAFEFISEKATIFEIRTYLESLPAAFASPQASPHDSS